MINGLRPPSEAAVAVAAERLADKPAPYMVDPGLILEVAAHRAQRDLDRRDEVVNEVLGTIAAKFGSDAAVDEIVRAAAETAAGIVIGLPTVNMQGEI